MKKCKLFSIFLAGCFLTTFSYAKHPEDWQKFKMPVAGEANPIGTYTNGCLIGGKTLPFEGEGFQVVRREHHRFFAHPEMYDYLIHLGKKVKAAQLPDMLIGDVAMPAGGRFASSHTSHQMGLDADIWFRMGRFTEKEAQHSTGLAFLMANEKTKKMTKNWTKQQFQLLKFATEDPRVARIFVNPVIKVHLCETLPKEERGWLRKIRPWYSHNAHFHVRLNCPKGASYCTNQAPVPKGDGCDATLYQWLKPKPPAKKPTKPVKPKPKVIPPPPPLCQLLLDQQSFSQQK